MYAVPFNRVGGDVCQPLVQADWLGFALCPVRSASDVQFVANTTASDAERISSAAAAALSDKKLRQTKIAADVGCSTWFGPHTHEHGLEVGFGARDGPSN